MRRIWLVLLILGFLEEPLDAQALRHGDSQLAYVFVGTRLDFCVLIAAVYIINDLIQVGTLEFEGLVGVKPEVANGDVEANGFLLNEAGRGDQIFHPLQERADMVRGAVADRRDQRHADDGPFSVFEDLQWHALKVLVVLDLLEFFENGHGSIGALVLGHPAVIIILFEFFLYCLEKDAHECRIDQAVLLALVSKQLSIGGPYFNTLFVHVLGRCLLPGFFLLAGHAFSCR